VKIYRGNRGISPLVLNLGTVSRWGVSVTFRPLYSGGKILRYPLNRGLGGGGSQSRSGSFGEEKSLLSCRDSNRGFSIPQLGHYTAYSATSMIIYNATERRLQNYLFILHVSLEFRFAFIGGLNSLQEIK
jgi:hypothetical protein